MSATPSFVCVRNCTCPASGDACALDSADCTVKIPTQGGSGRRRSGAALFFWLCFAMLLGAAAFAGWVHWNGIPPWLPIRERGYGLYNELSEHGI